MRSMRDNGRDVLSIVVMGSSLEISPAAAGRDRL
jgi:hypothetical protein